MVIYEVNLEIDPSIEVNFRAWLGPHIKEVLKCSGFISANWFEIQSSNETSEHKIFWTIQYHVSDLACLENYIQFDSHRLREDGLQRFGSKFASTRRVLNHIETFQNRTF